MRDSSRLAEGRGDLNDSDMIADGAQQLPANGTELNPDSTSSSEPLTISALQNLPGGSVALVAGHA